MATIKRFEDLEIWQSAREFCKIIFEFINKENFSKDYKLCNQINGSSGSIMDNIAEGFERSSMKEFIQFLSIAKGSAGESRSQLIRAFDRNYITEAEFNSANALIETIASKLFNLIAYLNKSSIAGLKFQNRVEDEQIIYQTIDNNNIQFDFD